VLLLRLRAPAAPRLLLSRPRDLLDDLVGDGRVGDDPRDAQRTSD
jgi:hypothetical protein